MVEGDVFENHILPDIRFRMTSFLEATAVHHLVMGFFDTPSRNDIGEAQLDIPKLPPEVIAESGRIVTLGTGHISMPGGLPRIDVDFHVVA